MSLAGESKIHMQTQEPRARGSTPTLPSITQTDRRIWLSVFMYPHTPLDIYDWKPTQSNSNTRTVSAIARNVIASLFPHAVVKQSLSKIDTE